MIIFFLLLLNYLVGLRFPQRCASDAKIPGYYWDGQQCLHCEQPMCLCTTYHGCTNCADKYYLDTDTNACKACPIGCSKCCELKTVTQIICTLCSLGYSNVHGVCFKVEGCLTFSSHGHCMLCDTKLSYFRNNIGTCTKCPNGCSGCYSEYYCYGCQDGYYLDTEYNSTSPTITKNSFICQSCNGISNSNMNYTSVKGCSICDVYFETNQIICNDCLPGYFFIEADQSCLECPKNCKVCVNARKCQACYENFLPPLNNPPDDSTLDTEGCHSCQDKIKYCISCLIEVINKEKLFFCDVCENGYYLNEFKTACIRCRTLENKGVARCDSETIFTQCQVGYLLINSTCIKNVNLCQKARDTTGNCQECEDGMILLKKTENVYICSNCSIQVQNCIKCRASEDQLNTICSICNNTYYEDAGICRECTENCYECDAFQCKVCNQGYVLNSRFSCDKCNDQHCIKCANAIQCIECQPNWGVTEEGTCWKCQIGCLDCEISNRFKCKKCDVNYYKTRDGACLKLPNHCKQANIDGYCYLCETQIPLTDLISQYIFPDHPYEEFSINDETNDATNETDETIDESEGGIDDIFDEDESNQGSIDNPFEDLDDISGNKDKSMFYKSVNGYCLVCSDYYSGVFDCPNQCFDQQFLIQHVYSQRIEIIFGLMSLLFLSS